jgi:hypothetical protein
MEGFMTASMPNVPAGTYKIRVTNQANGVVVGESDTFTMTAAPVSVSILNPLTGSTLKTGATLNIQYSPSNLGDTKVDILLARRELVANSPVQIISKIASGIDGSGGVHSYSWVIPTSLASANNYLLVACPAGQTEGGSCMRTSVFSIVNTTPLSSESPMSRANSGSNFMANVFYSVGDIVDSLF